MITAAQLRAARAMLHMDQRTLAKLSDLSLPTIQRMEASEGVIRGNVNSLMKLVAALGASGIELISDNATSSSGGRGIRLKRPPACRSRSHTLNRPCGDESQRGHLLRCIRYSLSAAISDDVKRLPVALGPFRYCMMRSS